MDPDKVSVAEESWAAFAEGVTNDLGIPALSIGGDYDHLTVEVDPATFAAAVQDGTLTFDLVRFCPGGGGTIESLACVDYRDGGTVDVTVIAKIAPPPMGGTAVKVGP